MSISSTVNLVPDKFFNFLSKTLSAEKSEVDNYLTPFIKLFILHCSVAHGLYMYGAPDGELLKYSFIPFSIAFLLAWLNKSVKASIIIVALTYLADRLMFPIWSMPVIANHQTLEYFVLALLLFFSFKKEEEASFILIVLRFFCIFIFFYAGLQKLLYGTYFFGQYLSFKIVADESFMKFFSFFISEEALKPVLEYHDKLSFVFNEGKWIKPETTGSYYINHWFMILASNLTWIGEILAGILLFSRRFRKIGVFITLGMLFLIELAAREAFFGLLYTSFLFLFLDSKYIKKIMPIMLVLYFLVALCVVGVIPIEVYER